MNREADMDLKTAETVRRALRPDPDAAPEIAARAGVQVTDAYRALVWLYDRGLARISRYPRNGRVRGWEAA